MIVFDALAAILGSWAAVFAVGSSLGLMHLPTWRMRIDHAGVQSLRPGVERLKAELAGADAEVSFQITQAFYDQLGVQPFRAILPAFVVTPVFLFTWFDLARSTTDLGVDGWLLAGAVLVTGGTRALLRARIQPERGNLPGIAISNGLLAAFVLTDWCTEPLAAVFAVHQVVGAAINVALAGRLRTELAAAFVPPEKVDRVADELLTTHFEAEGP